MGYDNYQLIGDENLIVQEKCENNWRVICAAPVKVIFSEDLQDIEKGNIYDSFKTNADYYLYGKKSKEEVVDAIVESFYK